MAGIPWSRFEGEKVGQKYLLGKVASVEGDQVWFHASDPERPGDDIALVFSPIHKRGWLSSATELKHPNLRLILAAGKTVVHGFEVRYCAMEPAVPSLADRLSREAPLSVTVVRELVGHVLGALGTLHQNGLVACRLSPAAIAHIDGRWKFGDVTHAREGGCSRAASTRCLLATSPHTPPEAYDGLISPAWDIYSLGVTLNECLLAPDLRKKGITQRLPAPFEMLVRLCLDPEPENRLTLTDIAAVLRLPRADYAYPVHAEETAREGARSEGRALRWLPSGA